MSTIRVPSYLSAPTDAVQTDPWLFMNGDEWAALGDELRTFDPAGRLVLSRRVSLDQHRIRLHCGLEEEDRVGLVALWVSRLTSLKGAGEIHELDARSDTMEAELRLDLDCGDIGGTLELRTALVLTRSGGTRRPLVAHLPGSVLWEDDGHKRVDLEGDGTRFPTELRRFGEGNGFPPRAAWYLDWDPGDLALPVLGSLRLYLNAGHPLMNALAEGQRSPDLDRVREALNFDVARQLLMGALTNGDFLADPDGYPADSVGAAIRRLCRGVLFQYSSLAELSVRAKRDPSRFEAELQASISLYWGADE